MSLYDKAIEILGDWFYKHEGEILLALQRTWPLEYAYAIVAQHAEDNEFDPKYFVVNLSILCEQISNQKEESFLSSIEEIISDLEGID